MTIHATTVAIDGHAVLITGPSGSGKSDLALRLIDRGAVLVADDYTDLSREDALLLARPPASIAGKIEVRGLGIVAMPHAESAPVALAVRLTDSVERMPEEASCALAGVMVPEIAIAPRPASAPIVVEMAMRRLVA